MSGEKLGPIVHSFFIDYLSVLKGLRPASIRSYRDALRMFLQFAAADTRHKITRLSVKDLSFERVQAFLRYLEEERNNHIRTRNQRLAALHTFFEYVATRVPEMLATAERVASIPAKRVHPAETCFLEREEVASLFANLPSRGKHALRDRALLLFLYNTGARVQEAATLRVGDIDFDSQPRVRLQGKGGKWRTCPLWAETARQIEQLLGQLSAKPTPESPVFVSQNKHALTRFGIYKIVRRHSQRFDRKTVRGQSGHITPHVFRHTAAAHLLEAGVEVNVIRAWLGHVSLQTTNHYAEVNIKAKEAALRVCEPNMDPLGESLRKPVWRNDDALLTWLDSL